MATSTKSYHLAARYPKTSLVTGASSGIGTAFAQALAQEGMNLVLVARRGDRLKALALELEKKFDIRVLVVVQDLTTPDASKKIYEETKKAQLEISLLINNAGFGEFSLFQNQDPNRAIEMVDLNCRAVVGMTYAFLPDMLRKKQGGIILVSSLSAFQAIPYFATYAASKAFDLLLGEALWAELKPQGIDVLTVCPGFTPTGFQEVAHSEWTVAGQYPITSPEFVVACALRTLGRKPMVIPGKLNWMAGLSYRFLPRSLITRVLHWAMRKKQNTKG